MTTEFELFPLGEKAIVIEFGQAIKPDIHRKVKLLADYLEQNPLRGIIEHVATYTSVTLFYEPMEIRSLNKESSPYQYLAAEISRIYNQLEQSASEKPRIVEIPVCYGGEFGPDLNSVAQYHHLAEEEVINIHSQGNYLVYMVGFAPGFPYLGGLPERIATPRRSSPRLAIPTGSVGIAGQQTGVYPITTPGGWQLIGRTPLRLFQPEQECPSLLKAGDVIKFYPISKEEYDAYEEVCHA